ncbi:alcohol dehydrogenase catalytic domain-containing protein [Amycolatopsis albispora]|uniref:alcohol dehydrogenase n=1 Tax=Amycolatopsis albispora TaxID=1804986 RepID=A0A344L120_9PSEU|nr:alcohol dehydrogenase catalytic domain-containing protein [Amycolatopsis albispora]AXB41744.1 alcohol dehydrogenase [Amycolatopsis albispora]
MTTSLTPVPTTTARYARWNGVGTPFSVVTTEVPAIPGPGEALVRVDLATVCGSDVHTVSGARPSPVPGVLGHEQVGTVLAVGDPAPRYFGEPATPVRPGARVVWSVTASCGECDRCARDLTQKCRRLTKYGHQELVEQRPLTGGFASHCLLVPGTTIVEVPDGLPDVVAAPAACATATVAAALAGQELRGAKVLVTGAGMLGLTAVAMAASAGAHVTVIDPGPAKRELARRFGAAETRDSTEKPGEVDLAVELSGAPQAVATCLDALAIGGTAVLAGSVFPGPAVSVEPERLIRGLHTITGVHNYRPADLQTAVDFLAAHHRDHPFAELVEGRYGLDQLDAAFDAARGGTAPRQAVLPSEPVDRGA